jgi:hypothetical protein
MEWKDEDGVNRRADEHPDFGHYEPLTILEYSDKALEMRAKALAPEKYREIRENRHVGPGGGPIRITTFDQNQALVKAIHESPKALKAAQTLMRELYVSTAGEDEVAAV